MESRHCGQDKIIFFCPVLKCLDSMLVPGLMNSVYGTDQTSLGSNLWLRGRGSDRPSRGENLTKIHLTRQNSLLLQMVQCVHSSFV